MIRADVFALLCVSQNQEYVKDQTEVDCLQKCLEKIHQMNEPRLKDMGFHEMVKGWNFILDRLCFSNNIFESVVVGLDKFSSQP